MENQKPFQVEYDSVVTHLKNSKRVLMFMDIDKGRFGSERKTDTIKILNKTHKHSRRKQNLRDFLYPQSKKCKLRSPIDSAPAGNFKSFQTPPHTSNLEHTSASWKLIQTHFNHFSAENNGALNFPPVSLVLEVVT